MRNIRKREIVKSIASDLDMSQRDVFNITQKVLDEVIDILARGDRIELRGFGVFEPFNKKGGTRHNPKTLQKIDVPQKRAVRFRMGKNLKDKMGAVEDVDMAKN